MSHKVEINKAGLFGAVIGLLIGTLGIFSEHLPEIVSKTLGYFATFPLTISFFPVEWEQSPFVTLILAAYFYMLSLFFTRLSQILLGRRRFYLLVVAFFVISAHIFAALYIQSSLEILGAKFREGLLSHKPSVQKFEAKRD